jgi:hypothetical protein
MGWKDKPTNIGGMELVSWLITGLFTGYRMACWLPIARLSSWRNPRQFGKSRSISMNKSHLVGGIQYLPLWKIWVRQLGSLFPIYGKKSSKPPSRFRKIFRKSSSWRTSELINCGILLSYASSRFESNQSNYKHSQNELFYKWYKNV